MKVVFYNIMAAVVTLSSDLLCCKIIFPKDVQLI